MHYALAELYHRLAIHVGVDVGQDSVQGVAPSHCHTLDLGVVFVYAHMSPHSIYIPSEGS